MTLLKLFVNISSRKINENDLNEMIIVCHSLNNNTCTGLVICLCLNANPLISLIPPEWPQILGIYSVVVLYS